jgi:hypothetical protein
MKMPNEQDEAIAGIKEGLADLEAGRMRSLNAVDAELRTKHAIFRAVCSNPETNSNRSSYPPYRPSGGFDG